jgi:hypothetical protein
MESTAAVMCCVMERRRARVVREVIKSVANKNLGENVNKKST